ncbi:MAG TPA: hypothetical protein VLY21_04635 [Nitrososphaerales archaeon]|nr:hypothetical protein [Nitrososphaerales archaeon]
MVSPQAPIRRDHAGIDLHENYSEDTTVLDARQLLARTDTGAPCPTDVDSGKPGVSTTADSAQVPVAKPRQTLRGPGLRTDRGSKRGNWSITFAVESEIAILGLAGMETPVYYLCHVGIPEVGIPLRLSHLVDILGETFDVTVVFVEVEIAERFILEPDVPSILASPMVTGAWKVK